MIYDSTESKTQKVINSELRAAIGGLIKTASGVISTSATSVEVSYSGTFINAYATMSGAVVSLDIAVAANKITFSCAEAPASALTCVVVYA